MGFRRRKLVKVYVLLLVLSVLDIFAIKNDISLMTISVLDALTVRLKLETKILHIVRCCPFRNMPRNVARDRVKPGLKLMHIQMVFCLSSQLQQIQRVYLRRFPFTLITVIAVTHLYTLQIVYVI